MRVWHWIILVCMAYVTGTALGVTVSRLSPGCPCTRGGMCDCKDGLCGCGEGCTCTRCPGALR